jgi:hypothetical protein
VEEIGELKKERIKGGRRVIVWEERVGKEERNERDGEGWGRNKMLVD